MSDRIKFDDLLTAAAAATAAQGTRHKPPAREAALNAENESLLRELDAQAAEIERLKSASPDWFVERGWTVAVQRISSTEVRAHASRRGRQHAGIDMHDLRSENTAAALTALRKQIGEQDG